MKKLFVLFAIIALTVTASQNFAQPTPSLSIHPKDAKPIASPRDSIVAATDNGVIITITYGSPGVWGRTVGQNLDPMDDSIWRAGANEATTFEVNKDVTIEGKRLSAGKYAFFTIKHGREWMLIFNKVWNTWGAYSYAQNKGSDALQVKVNQADAPNYFNERLKYVVAPEGKVYMMWGTNVISFTIK